MAKSKVSMTRVTNTSRQQISIQVRRPGGDFYLEEKQMRLLAGKSVILPTAHLMPVQITNLKARNMLQTSNAN